MKLDFTYDRQKDIWCILNKGKSSINSSNPTKVYLELVSAIGDSPNEEATSLFIDTFLNKKNLNVSELQQRYQDEYESISANFHKIAEDVFGIKLRNDIQVYLTINSRCPYNIEENWFFVPMLHESAVDTVMHELWHFYTWEKFGVYQNKLGLEKYNDTKEALTVILNTECLDFFPPGTQDIGYPRHKDLREKILELWNRKKDIEFVWNEIIK